MAGSVNKVILVGNLGRDPEIRFTQGGGKMAQLSVATSETWRDKQTGERREKTEWHRVVIFRSNVADVAERYLRKGSKVYIEGQLQTRKWQDNSGQERYSTEVVLSDFRGELTMLDGRREEGGEGGMAGGGRDDYLPAARDDQASAPAAPSAPSAPSEPSAPSAPSGGELDDEIPF